MKMKIRQLKCQYCGKVRKGEDDVNMSNSFCNNCSPKRAFLAKKQFHGRSVISVAGGKYIVSKQISGTKK